MDVGKKMLFNGGQDNDRHDTNLTKYTNDGETFADLPPTPNSLSDHCMVALEGDDLFITGGYIGDDFKADSDKSFVYNSDKVEWEELPGLPTPRTSLQCGTVHNADGDQEVIAAGGYDHGEGPLRTIFISSVSLQRLRLLFP